jgi:hypothetical protein
MTWDNIFKAMMLHTTLQKKKKKKVDYFKSPWMTHGISISVTEKSKLYRKYLKTPNRKNEGTYKKYKNKLNHIVKLAKKNYYEKQFVNYKNSSRMTWKTINEILNRRNEKSTLPDKFTEKVCNKALTNPTVIANNFNKYFINVGPELARQIRIEHNEKSFDRYLSASYVKYVCSAGY